jgi:hypothetical protein
VSLYGKHRLSNFFLKKLHYDKIFMHLKKIEHYDQIKENYEKNKLPWLLYINYCNGWNFVIEVMQIK